MNAPTDWTSPILIVAAAVILGALVAYVFAKRKSGPKLGDDLARKDLEAKRDVLIQQLRDLDENASPEEKERLEVETAGVLRELDRHAPSTGEAPVAPRAAISPAAKGFLWGVGSFAGLAALAYFVMQSSTPRQEGGTVTGNTPMQQQQQQPQTQQPDPMLQQLEAAVQRDPNNLQLRNDLAQAYIERDNLMAVFEQTKFVLDRSPNDSRALTFQALVRMAMGERETSVQMLQQATKSDPKNIDSWVALAWAYVQENKIKDAEAMIAEAAKQSPKDAARLQDVFNQMKSHAAMGAQQQASQGGSLPEGHPAIDATAPAAAPVAGGGDRKVTVTLEIDPAASSKAGVVYVMARNPMGGPPVAVKRVQVASFPITFDFGAADSMMGQPLPDKFRLEARLDSDGDAATKLPTDPSAMQADVAPGATVKLALK